MHSHLVLRTYQTHAGASLVLPVKIPSRHDCLVGGGSLGWGVWVTWSTATFGTVRISYVNHTSGAVMVCRRVSTYAHTRVCICVGDTACVYTHTQEH